MVVAYFDLQMGSLHHIRWLNMLFWIFHVFSSFITSNNIIAGNMRLLKVYLLIVWLYLLLIYTYSDIHTVTTIQVKLRQFLSYHKLKLWLEQSLNRWCTRCKHTKVSLKCFRPSNHSIWFGCWCIETLTTTSSKLPFSDGEKRMDRILLDLNSFRLSFSLSLSLSLSLSHALKTLCLSFCNIDINTHTHTVSHSLSLSIGVLCQIIDRFWNWSIYFGYWKIGQGKCCYNWIIPTEEWPEILFVMKSILW